MNSATKQQLEAMGKEAAELKLRLIRIAEKAEQAFSRSGIDQYEAERLADQMVSLSSTPQYVICKAVEKSNRIVDS